MNYCYSANKIQRISNSHGQFDSTHEYRCYQLLGKVCDHFGISFVRQYPALCGIRFDRRKRIFVEEYTKIDFCIKLQTKLFFIEPKAIITRDYRRRITGAFARGINREDYLLVFPDSLTGKKLDSQKYLAKKLGVDCVFPGDLLDRLIDTLERS